MSGDVQPRKRKDKKRRRDDEDTPKVAHTAAPQHAPKASRSASVAEDIEMHEQHDHGTGGHWCAKIFFFSLMAILVGLVGLIVLENRGNSDIDTPLSESRFHDYLEGWVDEVRVDDHHDEHSVLESLDELDDHDHDHDEPFSEEEVPEDDDDEEHGDEDDDGHDEHDDEDDADEHGDDHDDDDDDTEEADAADEAEDDEDDGASEEPEAEASEEAATADGDDDEDDGNATGENQSADADDDDDQADGGDDDKDDEDNNNDAEGDNDDNDTKEESANASEAADDDDDDGKDAASKQESAGDDDDDDNEPFDEEEDDGQSLEDEEEQVIDNDAGEDLHLQKLAQKDTASDADGDDDDPAPEQSSFAVKAGVGLALFVVGYTVLAKRAQTDGDEEQAEDAPAEQQSQRRMTLIAPHDEDDDDPGADNVDHGTAKTAAGGAQSAYSADLEEELRQANQMLEDHPRSALKHFDYLLGAVPPNPPWLAAIAGRAKALDRLAERHQDNRLLDEAIEAYSAIVVQHADQLADEQLLDLGTRCVELMRFKGHNLKAIPVHETLIARFNRTAEQRNQLATTLLLINRLADAKNVLHDTLLLWRTDGWACAHYGFVLKTLDNDLETAVHFLRQGIESGANGTADGRLYFALGDALQRLHRTEEARVVYQLGAQHGLFRSEYQRSLYNVDRLRAQPIWSVAETGAVAAAQFAVLAQNWRTIRSEAEQLLAPGGGQFRPEAENLRDRGDWRQFELFARGRRVAANCARTPLTCQIIEGFAAARTCSRGQVKFSVMQPGTHVWPHCGPTNCRLRAHLGLSVPRRTVLRVANKYRTWREGEWLIFDDSFEHEVWHNGTEARLVLIVDIWHPELTEAERKSLAPI